MATATAEPKTTKSDDASQAELELQLVDYRGQVEAINRSNAVIEFDLDGTILSANENFLGAVGYTLDEVVGQHHSLFVDEAYKSSAEYKQFWKDLASGKFQSAEYCRFGKGGQEIWIQASYNPIFDSKGNPFKVVKYATDITDAKLQNADYEGQLKAIDRSQAVIEFELDGTIRRANENFLATLGYTEAEIVGQHHRKFVSPEEAGSIEYRQHWESLAQGEFKSGEYKRFTKAGEEIWIQASYNPIFDHNGRPFKVVKYASDITAEKNASIEATKVKNMMEGMAASITFADTDLVIRYANPSAIQLLSKIEEHLPVKAADVVGQSIDIFHKHPEHQRKLLANPANFPFEGQITIGDEVFLLKANTVADDAGEHLGVLVTWELVTAKVAQEKQIADNIERERQQAQLLSDKANKILELVNAAAAGDLTQSIDTDSEDAIDQIASGLNTFFGDLRKNVASIADNASALAGASEELSSVSTQMSANAEETSSQANVVSSASDEVSQNVQTTATGVEELNAAIREIAKNASDAARVSQQAVSIVDNTNTTIAKLGDSSTEIGKVVKVITSIAEQTNLLALNATIEAARAGEAGKGFAVVANEVKELAKETAKATEDISHKIETIQSDTGGAVEAIQKITEVINQINDISSTIASAVEEQTATANEMGRNVAEASKGANEIASNITSVASAAESTSQGAANSQQAASELSRMAAELQELVGRFQY